MDFVCIESYLVIELDGEYHDFIVEADLERQDYLQQQGFEVLRFWNEDVMKDAEAVARAIQNAIKGKSQT